MAIKKSVMCPVSGCAKPGPRTEAGAQWHAANMHKSAPIPATPKASTPRGKGEALAGAGMTAMELARVLGPILEAVMERQTAHIIAALKPAPRSAPKAKAPLVATVPQGPPASNPALVK